MTPDTHPRYGRRLGIFWFWGEGRKQSRFIGISRLWTYVATAEDKRCLEVSHEQGWRHVQALSRRLSAFRFDHFPRDRLEWHSATDQWRLTHHSQGRSRILPPGEGHNAGGAVEASILEHGARMLTRNSACQRSNIATLARHFYQLSRRKLDRPDGLQTGSPPSPSPQLIRPSVRLLLRSPRFWVRVPLSLMPPRLEALTSSRRSSEIR
jgi:hypothetical protein